MDKAEVFFSNIEIGQSSSYEGLYNLLNFDPIPPVPIKIESKAEIPAFEPRTDKHFTPKKCFSKLSKVKTVRDIRNEYEKEIMEYLPSDLQKQESFLLRKIRTGSAREDDTVKIVKNLFKNNVPKSRSTWQIITNINPENQSHSTQYVLWNGKKIRVTGSKGGEKRFLCNFDIDKKRVFGLHRSLIKTNKGGKTNNLLKNSLLVKFKPGPLSKKVKLDNSYQKIHVGESNLVNLPDIGLEVIPSLGVALEPTISNILSTLRDDENGALTEKWAMFAVSTLGKIKENEIGVTQTNKDAVIFDLSYQNNQNKVLMRHNESFAMPAKESSDNIFNIEDKSVASTVQSVLDDILSSVEISVTQDIFSTEDDEPRSTGNEDFLPYNIPITPKEKPKRKCYELEKLAVTVIRLTDAGSGEKSQCCRSFCSYGCICASLQSGHSVKMHCGRIDCMFECKCDFSKHKYFNSFDDKSSEIIPGLLDLDSRINSKLAKEEQKFHQTVVVTEEKSIVLKSQRRNLKTPKRYAEFYNTVNVKNENTLCNDFSIFAQRLDCRNVEPWCMVHNLYKCFCEGKFTERNSSESEKERYSKTEGERNTTPEHEKYLMKVKPKDIRNKSPDIPDATEEYSSKFDCTDRGNKKYSDSKKSFSNTKKIRNKSSESASECSYQPTLDSSGMTGSLFSARTIPYSGRGYELAFYLKRNERIKYMEENDVGLHKKLLQNVAMDEDETANPRVTIFERNISDDRNVILSNSTNSLHQSPTTSNDQAKRFPNKGKLIRWLEANYKNYKERLQTGKNLPMEAPRLGKIALYAWEVILERYRSRKNYFLVTKEVPYRIFMGVDLKNPFFDNCVMIDRIPFEDLRNYPITVRNLLEDAQDMNDNFYILCGLPHCWELIGSVTKLGESQKQADDSASTELSDSASDLENSVPNKDTTSNTVADCTKMVDIQIIQSPEQATGSQISKWFAMIVENDFNEIQFCDRGFFVKYDNIMKAVSFARVSGKSVRLSPQKTSSLDQGPQFGVYAIPHPRLCCAFVGPYERNDPLGFETIQSQGKTIQLQSRGVCIITPKSDNINIIDNPLLYLPKIDNYGYVILVNNVDPTLVPEISSTSDIEGEKIEPPKKKLKIDLAKTIKILKPIKIRKTNGFYQLAGGSKTSLLKPINTPPPSFPSAPQTITTEIIHIPEDPPEMMQIPVIQNTFSLVETFGRDKILAAQNTTQRPVAEIAPQVKCSEANKGMIILKPDEINKRVPTSTEENSSEVKSEDAPKNESNMDIENFLATCKIQTAPKLEDVFVLSDDEEENNIEPCPPESKQPEFQEVWFECKNIETLGWIKGRRNSKNGLSFEFPGFKYTDFYSEEEAFVKINQVLSRKVYIPKVMNIQWQVVEVEKNLNVKHMLKAEDLGPEMILTQRGLLHKSSHLNSVKADKQTIMSTLDELKTAISPTSLNLRQPVAIIQEAKKLIRTLEKQSKDLEDKVYSLNSDNDFRKSEILNLLIKAPEDVRREVTENIKEFDCTRKHNNPWK